MVAQVLPLPGAVVMLEIDLPRPGDHDGQVQPDLLLRAEGTVLPHACGKGEFVVMITHAAFEPVSLAKETERSQGYPHAAC